MGSQLASWWPSRPRLTLTTWADTTASPSDLPLVWTPSPRDLTLPPRAMLLMPTSDTDTMDSSTERDLLRLTPSTDTDTLLFPSDLPLVWIPSPRDMLLMLMATMDTDTDLSMERDLLMLRLIPSMDMDTLLFPSDLPLVWTPSPRDLMLPPRDMLLMLMATSDTTRTHLRKEVC